ncbi:hypothetical protein LG3211_4422 [Lysobacter gummosus]|nr:hypothetical protein LG3211_4422 [Lysobacter gummosus]
MRLRYEKPPCDKRGLFFRTGPNLAPVRAMLARNRPNRQEGKDAQATQARIARLGDRRLGRRGRRVVHALPGPRQRLALHRRAGVPVLSPADDLCRRVDPVSRGPAWARQRFREPALGPAAPPHRRPHRDARAMPEDRSGGHFRNPPRADRLAAGPRAVGRNLRNRRCAGTRVADLFARPLALPRQRRLDAAGLGIPSAPGPRRPPRPDRYPDAGLSGGCGNSL